MPLTKPTPTALVYPAHALAAYSIMRALGERQVPVIALGPAPHPHMRSRWASSRLSPDLAQDPVGFVDFINRVAAELPDEAVLYLVEDVLAYLIHQHRERLSPRIHFPWMEPTALRRCLDKQPMLETAQSAGIPIPWTRFAPSSDELDPAWIPFPCLVKPLVSRFSLSGSDRVQQIDLFPQAFGGKCVRVDCWDALCACLDQAARLGIRVLLQEWVPGPMDRNMTCYVYADSAHRSLAMVTTRKARQFPADFGNGTFRLSLPSPVLAHQTARLVTALGFSGIGSVEFRHDARDGQLKLLEINPRPGRNIGVAHAFGINLPFLQYADLTGLPWAPTLQDYQAKWFDEEGEWRFYQHYGKQKASPYHVTLWDWLAPLAGATPAVFNWRDPLPSVLKLVPRPLWQLKRRLSPSASS